MLSLRSARRDNSNATWTGENGVRMTKIWWSKVSSKHGKAVVDGSHILPRGNTVSTLTWHVGPKLMMWQKITGQRGSEPGQGRWCGILRGMATWHQWTNEKVPHGPTKWCHMAPCQHAIGSKPYPTLQARFEHQTSHGAMQRPNHVRYM